MGGMDKVCVVCRQLIGNGEQWFRVREESVHLSCSEKYLKMVSERKQAGKAAPRKEEKEVQQTEV